MFHVVFLVKMLFPLFKKGFQEEKFLEIPRVNWGMPRTLLSILTCHLVAVHSRTTAIAVFKRASVKIQILVDGSESFRAHG